MGAIGYQKTPTSDKAWDGAANEKRLRSGESESYYRKMYAWQDPEADPKTKSAYKFPHHEVDSSGEIGAANVKACQSVISVLNGGMGGTDIPKTDRQGVYDHVAHHLRDAGATPADLRSQPLAGPGVMEFRALTAADFAVEDEGVISGHSFVVGEWAPVGGGLFEEVFEPGCFDKTDFRDVLFSGNVNHDLLTVPLARSRNNNANSTLQLSIDQRGVAFRARLDLENNFHARALYSAIKRQDVTGMSGLFKVAEDRWEGLDTEKPRRHILAVERVREITASSMPVYEGTDINARDQSALESAKRALESARAGWLDSQQSERRAIRALKDALLGREAG